VRRYASAGTSYGAVSVCLSVTSRSSIETDERIKLLSGTGASFDLSYAVLYENSGISKTPEIRVLPFGTLSQTLET